jgi:hypothetical protein
MLTKCEQNGKSFRDSLTFREKCKDVFILTLAEVFFSSLFFPTCVSKWRLNYVTSELSFFMRWD